MRRFIQNLFGRKSQSVRRVAPKPQLGLNQLEDRSVPATLLPLSAFGLQGNNLMTLYIPSSNGNDTVTVTPTTINNVPYVQVVENGTVTNILRPMITAQQIRFFGNDGHDTFTNLDSTLATYAYGGAGNDTLNGAGVFDYLFGEAGVDTLHGNGGNDYLDGGTNTDYLYGDGDADRLYGQSGNDFLYGGSGNDFLNGGTGLDVLDGGSGRDGLLGGPGDEGDGITGGSGQDRFLDWTNDMFGNGEVRADVSSSDVVVTFRNDGEQDVPLGSNMGWRHYSAGTWTDSQIESVDKGMRILQEKTDNTRLLKTSGGGSLTFHKAGSTPGDPAGGWNNGGGSIVLTNAGTESDSDIQSTTVHEIGHNWDDESPYYQSWLALSGWEQNSLFINPVGKVPSGDGQWWHNANAQFARNYGKMNPHEDFATSWEAYFGLGGTQVAAKMQHLDLFFSYITLLG